MKNEAEKRIGQLYPKIKITRGRHLLNFFIKIFSTEINTIDKAIRGSTISGIIFI